MHHMADAPVALQRIRRVLQPNAIFILEFANKQNLKAIARYLLRKQRWSPFSPEPVEFAPLNFDFHPKVMRSWLTDNQFTIERQLTVSHFRLGLLKKIIPLKLLVQMDAAAQKTGNLWQLTPSVFTRARASGASPLAGTGSLFACPNCEHDSLAEQDDEIHCPVCKQGWGIRSGIYDFRSPLEA
jgi:hypothetical protein